MSYALSMVFRAKILVALPHGVCFGDVQAAEVAPNHVGNLWFAWSSNTFVGAVFPPQTQDDPDCDQDQYKAYQIHQCLEVRSVRTRSNTSACQMVPSVVVRGVRESQGLLLNGPIYYRIMQIPAITIARKRKMKRQVYQTGRTISRPDGSVAVGEARTCAMVGTVRQVTERLIADG